ncbi:hypothetical protein ABK040_002212 [Willaertia magna]
MLYLFEHNDVKVEQILYLLVFYDIHKSEVPSKVFPDSEIYKKIDTIDLHLRPEHENIKFLYDLKIGMKHNNKETFKKCVGKIKGLKKNSQIPILEISLPILEYNNGKICEKLEEPLQCTVKLEYVNMNNNADLIFKGLYTFLPNTSNDNAIDELRVCIDNYELNNNHISSNNNTSSSNNCQTSINGNCVSYNCTMSYNEFKYKINNYKKEYFKELSKLFKCPLGFSILSHFISRGYKDECIELIKLGYNPNEVDTLNRNSYYWSDYYKYDNNNEIDSKWLENIYLKYEDQEKNYDLTSLTNADNYSNGILIVVGMDCFMIILSFLDIFELGKFLYVSKTLSQMVTPLFSNLLIKMVSNKHYNAYFLTHLYRDFKLDDIYLKSQKEGLHFENNRGFNENQGMYEKYKFNEFINTCEQCLNLLRKFEEILFTRDEYLFKKLCLKPISQKLPLEKGVPTAPFQLLVPSLFLSNHIGNISKAHKKFPLHFVVKAMIFKKEEEQYSCGILFGKWLVKYNNESGLIDVKAFSGSLGLELIYSTDLFRVDQQINNHYDQQMLDNFIYNFAQFCCWWNVLALDSIYNSFHFVYCAIKYFDFEKNLKEHDILIPFIKNIIIHDNCILYYNPPSDFISTIRDIIKNKKEKVKCEFWDDYYNLILNNNNDIVIEFDELEDIESYISFIEYYYPGYLYEQQSTQSLGVFRNILISNKLKFEEFNMKSKEELFCNFSGYSTRIKYHIGNSLDSVIEGKVIPEEFKESENFLLNILGTKEITN